MTWLMIERGVSLVLLSQHITMEGCEIAKANFEKRYPQAELSCVWLGYSVCPTDECRKVEIKQI